MGFAKLISMRRLAVLAVALVLTGCSGGGGSGRDAPGDAAAEAATTTTEPVFTGAGSERFCEQARTAQERLNRLAVAAPTAEAVREQFTSAAEAVRSLAPVAPAEIAPDVRTVVRAYDDLVGGLQRADWDPSQLAAETSDKLGAPQVRVAVDRLAVYQQRVCGIG